MTKHTFRMLAIRQLDCTLGAFRQLLAHHRPASGWVATVRQTLGMSTRQLAERMGEPASRVHSIEKGEVDGKATLEAIGRAAEALNCTLVYALVPNKSLEEFLNETATKAVTSRAEYVNHHMALEDQRVADERLQQLIRDEVAAMLVESPQSVWDKPK
jgi:predicted DNA-binding mobile mystery protein A